MLPARPERDEGPREWLDRRSGHAMAEEGCFPNAMAAEASSLMPASSTAFSSMAAEAAQLVEAAHEAQNIASKALAAALALGGPDEVVKSVVYAKERVDCPEGTPETAAKALMASSRARASCPPGELHASLGRADKSVRDFLVWKTQLRAPLGDRNAFVDSLTAAVGARVIDTNMFSHLMHSHSKEVCSRFPNAFLSNAKYQALRRSGRRPARTRSKAEQQAAGEGEEPAAEEGEEPAAEEQEQWGQACGMGSPDQDPQLLPAHTRQGKGVGVIGQALPRAAHISQNSEGPSLEQSPPLEPLGEGP